MNYARVLFSKTGAVIAAYVLIGVFANTAPPHLPTTSNFTVASLHSWVQYVISIFSWPMSLWHPTFTVGKWTGK